jgi:glycosyltransferase involved in cell wall biosynthesis
MKAPTLTVLTCTRNGSRTIEAALEAVCRQVDLAPGEVELIVVDNGSKDATPDIVRRVLDTAPFPSTFLSAQQEGKVNALIAGLSAARGEFVCIVDDDNIINDIFLRRGIDFFRVRPQVGLICGVNTLAFLPPTPWFHSVRDFFACGLPYYIEPAQQIDAHRHVSRSGIIPGAGSVFRRNVLMALMEDGFFFLNETFRGARMSVTGEDRELAILFQLFGWEVGHDTQMQLKHDVDAARINPRYLARLCESIGAGNAGTDLLEAQRDGSLDHWKQSWWWRAYKHLQRIMDLAPGAFVRRIRGGPIDMQFADWHMEIGALRRFLTEREKLIERARARSKLAWSRRTDIRGPVEARQSRQGETVEAGQLDASLL